MNWLESLQQIEEFEDAEFDPASVLTPQVITALVGLALKSASTRR